MKKAITTKKKTARKSPAKSALPAKKRKSKVSKTKQKGVTAPNKKPKKTPAKKSSAQKGTKKSGLGILTPSLRKKIESALTQLEDALAKLEDKAIKKLS